MSMNTSKTKIRKIQEANKIAEERFLMSEQANPTQNTKAPVPVPGQPKPGQQIGKKLPTDFNQSITFLFPDFTAAIIKPSKQDISKAIINLLGLGAAPQGNVFSLVPKNGAKVVCGSNPFTSKVYIFTKPDSMMSDWCSLENVSPDYMTKAGIFAIPNKPEYIQTGTWKAPAPKTEPEKSTNPTQPNQQVKTQTVQK